jgi:methyltransferase (TIGR00027 family)
MPATPLSPVHLTAFGAAAMRARHVIVDGDPKILADYFAQQLIGMDAEQIVSHTNDMTNPLTAATWILRSRFAEDCLAAARTRHVQQYVILGAGLDSYALRHADTRDDLIVYEVDDPALQHWKRQRLKALHIPIPTHLQFVTCDFETTSLVEALRASTFAAGAAAEVSWLGVTQYLTPEAIGATLRWAASLATGSEIVLTYVVPGDAAEAARRKWAARGTRFETFFAPEAISSLLAEAGLVDIQQVHPAKLQSVYFAGRTDGLVAPEVERLIIGKSP